MGSYEKKETLVTTNAIAAVSSNLDAKDEELLKAVTKCLAKFTQHADQFVALQIQGEGQGFSALVECCTHEKRSVWEPALATLVNISFVECLRPILGNAGVIWTFITKASDEKNLGHGDFFRTISALCLYCYESVNRMKLRDAGGLRLFVNILEDAAADEVLKNKIIKSLTQFAYDEQSLKVLQHAGLVQALLTILEEHNSKNEIIHSCEEFMRKGGDDQIESEPVEKDQTAKVKKASPVLMSVEEHETNEESTDADDIVEEKSTGKKQDERQYRINSPSYREVQDEVEEFAKIRSSLPGSSSWNLNRSIGMSPLYSRSPSPAASRSESPLPSYSCSSSPLWSSSTSPMSDPEDRCPPTYSPIEYFSDEDEDANDLVPVVIEKSARSNLSEAGSSSKKARISNCVQTLYQPMYVSVKSPFVKPSPSTEDEAGLILQVLSRLAQSEVPHESLCSFRFAQTLIKYLSRTRKPSKRAGRILLRVSQNLYCLMPFVNQRTMSWLRPEIESRPTIKESPCQDCLELLELSRELAQNFSLLAETGYAEGVMCHTLVKGEVADKQNVAIGVPLLVRPRKLLVNILVNHEGLEVLLDIIEKHEQPLFTDAVYSLSVLSGHVGIVSPNLKLFDYKATSNRCRYSSHSAKKNLAIKVDDGRSLMVNRHVLTEASGVFEAMLAGQFAESNQSEVQLPMTSYFALTCLIHHLYGCRWCPTIYGMPVKILLELAALTDKYLLTEFNRSISYEIVRRCMKVDQVVEIYEASLQNEYPVMDESLNVCAISYLLVGDIDHQKRAEIFAELIKSKMASDFMDDVNRILREKLLNK